MKKQVYGRKFSRDIGSRAALFRSLVVSFVRSGEIKTTLPRAKAVKPLIDHLVTLSKKGDLNSRRKIIAELAQDEAAARKIEEEAKARFKELNSGFTRTVRVGKRVGDNATVVKLMWSREPEKQVEQVMASSASRKGKNQSKSAK
ncbi:50S ribosomal protein L17 [Candidatus Microgenomates bacterium]|nr:50S ribosomal protein L17 [Candidatus Microgenomates bacterium]